MHRLPQVASEEATESFLAGLRDRSGSPAIQVPTRIRGIDLGGLATTVQSVISWARRNPDGEVRLYSDELTLQDLRSPHLLAAVLMGGKITGPSGVDITLASRRLAIAQLNLIAERPMHGQNQTLVAADHTSFGSPSMLYVSGSKGRAVRKPGQFERFISVALHRQNWTIEESRKQAIAPTLRGLLYELFDNTDKHARTDTAGRALGPSVRMVLTRGVQAPLADLLSSQSPSSSLTNYLSHAAFARDHANARAENMRRFFELSVVDSGIGMVDRAALSGIRFGNPVDAVTWCLRKNVGSSFASYRGRGLPEVLRLLSDSAGFLRIRTGQVEFLRDFQAAPFDEKTEADGPVSRAKWVIRDENDGIADVSGTLVSLFVPTVTSGEIA